MSRITRFPFVYLPFCGLLRHASSTSVRLTVVRSTSSADGLLVRHLLKKRPPVPGALQKNYDAIIIDGDVALPT
uniref:Response regulatory domain-containing protein n=1 Tax=Caenorhabditis tropicalis TaxID=1561998 RepID=A0A1I7UAR4_9PELO